VWRECELRANATGTLQAPDRNGISYSLLTCDCWVDAGAVVLELLVVPLRKVLERGVGRQALLAERVEDTIHI